jgi:WD40 repeat protein
MSMLTAALLGIVWFGPGQMPMSVPNPDNVLVQTSSSQPTESDMAVLVNTWQPFIQPQHDLPANANDEPSPCYLNAAVAQVAISDDNRYLAVGGHVDVADDGAIHALCTLAKAQLSLMETPTGQRIAALIDDGFTYRDPPSTMPLADEVDITVGEFATGLLFIPDSPVLIASLADGTVRLWDRRSGMSLGQWDDHGMAVWTIAASEDGRWVATGSADQTIRVREIVPTTGRILSEQVLPETDIVKQVRLSDDGQTLVSILGREFWGSTTIHLWRQESGQWRQVPWRQFHPFPEIPEVEGYPSYRDVVPRTQLTPDGKTLITGDEAGQIRLWLTHNGARKLTLNAHQGAVRSLAVSPDSQVLVSEGTDNLKVWNLTTGQLIRILPIAGTPKFSQDGRLLLVAQPERTDVWNWRLPARLTTIPAANVTLSADGTLAISYSDEQVQVWQLP